MESKDKLHAQVTLPTDPKLPTARTMETAGAASPANQVRCSAEARKARTVIREAGAFHVLLRKYLPSMFEAVALVAHVHLPPSPFPHPLA